MNYVDTLKKNRVLADKEFSDAITQAILADLERKVLRSVDPFVTGSFSLVDLYKNEKSDATFFKAEHQHIIVNNSFLKLIETNIRHSNHFKNVEITKNAGDRTTCMDYVIYYKVLICE